MLEKQENKIQNKSVVSKTQVKEEIEVKPELLEVNRSIHDLNKTVQNLSDTASDMVTKYLEHKTEMQKQLQIAEDNQHKRSIYSILSVLLFVFLFCSGCLYLGQIELIKYILGSSIAIAAGAGLKSIVSSKIKS